MPRSTRGTTTGRGSRTPSGKGGARTRRAAKRTARRAPTATANAAGAGRLPDLVLGGADTIAMRAAEAAALEPAPTRIELPSSGLAEDILGSAAAAAIATHGRDAGGALEPAPQPGPTAAGRSHVFSFFAQPARDEVVQEATEHLATFLVGGEEYAVDVRLVQEIIRASEITPVPRAPESVRGVINLRGRIIPVVDLRRRLGLADDPPSRRSRIVVTLVEGRAVGLLVDGASQVLRVPLSRIENAPEEVVAAGAGYVRGVAKLDRRLIILIDLAKLLFSDALEPSAASPQGQGVA